MKRLSAFAFALVVIPMISAQNRENPGNTPKSTDEKFVMGALVGGEGEVKAGQLALQRSNDPNVKKIAQMMIDDHTKCNAEFKQLLTTRRMMPTSPTSDPVATAMFQKLSSLQGADFDECYIGSAILCHEGAIMCFTKEAKKGQDAELKAFATKALPKLKEHLKMLRSACESSLERGTYETTMEHDNK